MRKQYRQRISEMDPTEVEIHFSSAVRQAFQNLSAAMHFSEQMEPDTKSILKDWADGKSDSVRGVVTSLASIAEEVFKHVNLNDDERPAEAWAAVTDALVDHGFTLARIRSRSK
jgi:hypothetical protein